MLSECSFYAQLDKAVKKGLKSFLCSIGKNRLVLISVINCLEIDNEALFMYTVNVPLSEIQSGSYTDIGLDQLMSTPSRINIIYINGIYYIKQDFLSEIRAYGNNPLPKDMTIIDYDELYYEKNKEVNSLIENSIHRHEGAAKKIYENPESEYTGYKRSNTNTIWDEARAAMFQIQHHQSNCIDWTIYTDNRKKNVLSTHICPVKLTQAAFIRLLIGSKDIQTIADDFIHEHRTDLAKYFDFEKEYDRLINDPNFLTEKEKAFVKCLDILKENETVIIKLKNSDELIPTNISEMAMAFSRKHPCHVANHRTGKSIDFTLDEIELIKQKGSTVFPYLQTTIYDDTDKKE